MFSNRINVKVYFCVFSLKFTWNFDDKVPKLAGIYFGFKKIQKLS